VVFEPLPIRVMLVSSVYITVLLWSLEVGVIESTVLLKIRYNIFCKIYINIIYIEEECRDNDYELHKQMAVMCNL
jgi:hypothetical protein